ncbi:MAG: YggU family protein [Bradymonadales bacterium]|nr:YggU family protein [Bradymonadales bacterium]
MGLPVCIYRPWPQPNGPGGGGLNGDGKAHRQRVAAAKSVGMTKPWLRESGDGVEIQVLVVPRASISELAGLIQGRLKVRLAAPPVEGKANQELIRFLARTLGFPKGDLELAGGATSRRKTVRIRGASLATIEDKVTQVLGDSA